MARAHCTGPGTGTGTGKWVCNPLVLSPVACPVPSLSVVCKVKGVKPSCLVLVPVSCTVNEPSLRFHDPGDLTGKIGLADGISAKVSTMVVYYVLNMSDLYIRYAVIFTFRK